MTDSTHSWRNFRGSGHALQRSTLRRKANREEHALVPAEFMKWVWAGGRKLKGLVRRREAEAWLYADARNVFLNAA